jgi:hypothetical protein
MKWSKGKLASALGTIAAGAFGCSVVVQAPHEHADASTESADAEPVTTQGGHESASEPLDGGASQQPPDAGDALDSSQGPSEPDAESQADASDALPATPACEAGVLAVARVVPEVMLVLDRSQSMAPAVPTGVSCVSFDLIAESTNCSLGNQAACNRLTACQAVDCAQPPYQGTLVCGGTNPSPAVDRWMPAVQGLGGLTRQFQAQLSFGLTLFPGDAAGPQGAGDICAPATVRVPVGANAAPAIARALDGTAPGGATPLASALTAALSHLEATPTASAARYLLLLTDGQPTCPNARGNTLNPETLAQDHAAALEALDALSAARVKTYVLGFVAPGETALATALDEFATRGGTGHFYPVRDSQSIIDHFAKIAPSIAAPCSVMLEAERDALQLSVQLDSQKLQLDAKDGWVLKGAELTLQGDACQKFSDGRAHRLSVEAACEPLAP